jgi:ATP phosphoribosyltransferase
LKQFLEADHQKHLKKIIEINKRYASNLDNFEKSLKVLIEKIMLKLKKVIKIKPKNHMMPIRPIN